MIDLDEEFARMEAMLARRERMALGVTCKEMIELITRLRQAEKDAARYRWLRDECKHGDWHTIGASDPCEWDLIVDGCIDEAMNGSNK